MSSEHRIVCFAMDTEPAHVGKWTTDLGSLGAQLDQFALSTDGDPGPESYDWVYIERRDDEPVRVAFAGQARDLPDARAYLVALRAIQKPGEGA